MMISCIYYTFSIFYTCLIPHSISVYQLDNYDLNALFYKAYTITFFHLLEHRLLLICYLYFYVARLSLYSQSMFTHCSLCTVCIKIKYNKILINLFYFMWRHMIATAPMGSSWHMFFCHFVINL